MNRSGLVFLIAILGLLVQPLPQAWGQGAGGTEIHEEVEIAPVSLDGLELFQIRGIRSYPAKRRAREIQERLLKVAKDPSFALDALHHLDGPQTSQIQIGDFVLLNLFEADAKVEGVSRGTLAEGYTRILKDAIHRYRWERKPERIRRGIYYSVAATGLFFLILALFHWIFGKIKNVLKRKEESGREQTIKFKKLKVIEADRFWKGIRGFFSGVRVLLTLALLYFFLQFILNQFPWTRFIATQLLELVVGPLRTIGHSVIDYIPNLIFLIILAGVVALLLKFVKTFFGSVERKTFSLPGFEPEWARPTYRILRMLIIIFSVVVAYPYIPGSNSDAFKGVSIFVGVLFSLGSTSAIANIIAGYSLIYRRAFKAGDRIQIGEIVGDVIEMRLQVTHLCTIKNEAITVPNSLILNSHVINFSTLEKTQGLILHTNVGIGYEVPWRQVEAMLLRAAERAAGVLQDPRPFVLIKKLGDFSVDYELNAYCQDSHKMASTYDHLHCEILDEFNEHGVAIMTPAYESDPDTPKVVPKENWYAPPAQPPTKS